MALRDAAERALRHPQRCVALVLHLSRLHPPAPRPHHARIARAILQDAAQRHEGQVFAPRNGDLVLLCRAGGTTAPHAAAERSATVPEMLPAVFARLLRLDAPDPAALVSLWPLAGSGDALLAYAAERLAERAPHAATASAAPDIAHSIGAVPPMPDASDLTHLQTAVLIAAAAPAAGAALRPLFRDIGRNLPALAVQLGTSWQDTLDPYVLSHAAARFDRRMLAMAQQTSSAGRRLPLHLKLTLPTLLGPGFATVAARCRDDGQCLGAEISLIEASADAAGFAAARRLTAGLGVTLVLGGVSHLALLLARPWMLRQDLLKLDWAPAVAALAPDERAALLAALRAAGPSRIVLHAAVDEAAVAWGRAQGIRRFQGQHVDAMLAASRMAACPQAAGCTLRQCRERAAATAAAGRRFCRNHALLDAGAP